MSWKNTKTPLKPDGHHKWQIGSENGKLVLTEKDEERLRQHYPIEMNETLMQWFGISSSSLHRIARKLGLKKKINIIKKKCTKKIRNTCKENGYYDSLRGKKPSQKCIDATKRKRAEGFCPIEVYRKKHPKEYQDMVKRQTDQLHALRNRDRRRLDLGLDPIVFTSMAQAAYTKHQIELRNYAKRIGYTPGSKIEESGQRWHIFYTDGTKRIPSFEKRCEDAGLYIDRLVTKSKVSGKKMSALAYDNTFFHQ